ncbi:MAG: aspartate kinase [Bacteroidales bacterium]|nr:aspartate kinase [Bacteroidales bacterium]MCF8454969.1 aspartate kinase [Bacteroidales bacterium]
MKVFKFGGASVKSARSVQNLAAIIKNERDELVVVISAMDKTTNLLEALCSAFFSKQQEVVEIIGQLVLNHQTILQDLFPDEDHPVYDTFNRLIDELRDYTAKDSSLDFDIEYDQIVSYGELISTNIISAYLNEIGISNTWLDIRTCLKTGNEFRDAKINWEISEKLVQEKIDFGQSKLYVTQGFIGSTSNNLTTTLGREGSDFTAAILTFLLNANEIVIWKDVAGIYNADPNQFREVEKLDKISYQEAIELAYFGAKVIHPKTIKPLQNKNIPLKVKSFEFPDEEGTTISAFNERVEFPPVYIVKEKQVLISISPKDFSFIAEDNLSKIFAIFANHRVKVNLSENSAISFSACVDYDDRKFKWLIEELNQDFKVYYNTGLKLITIRHHTEKSIEKMTAKKNILVEQKNRLTARFVVGEESN